MIGGNIEISNKKQIASKTMNSSYKDEIFCSLLDEQIMKKCGICFLKKICDGIENISEELNDRTTKAVKILN